LALSFATLFSVTNVLLKTNQVEWSRAAAADVLDLIPGMIISLCAAILLNNLLPAHWVGIPLVAEMSESEATPGIINIWGGRSLLPNGMLVLAAGLAVFGFIITRYRSRLITGIATRWIAWRGTSRSGVERALIIGGGNTGQYAAWMLQNGKYSLSLHVVGFVDDSLYMQETRIHGLNVLGRREDIPALVDELDIGILVFAIHNISPQERQDLIDICHKTSARVFEFPDIPNAIRQVSRSTGPHNGSKPTNHKPRASKPSTSQTSAIPSEDLDRLLARLEQMLESGDTSETLAEIQQMRKKLYDENPTIQTAHVSSVD
jgi:FlaA1/EpsC-like NDP-sugar epimerase